MKALMVVAAALFASVEAHAEGYSGRLGIGIGDDGEVKAIIFVTDYISLRYGYYHSTRHVDANSGSSYTQSTVINSLGVRNYFTSIQNTSAFVDLEYSQNQTNYAGQTTLESYKSQVYGMYSGIEYRFNENVSVAGRFGIEFYTTNFQSYVADGNYFPTTNLSVNYIF
ncbi:MAG: hypothetical protein OEW08_03065 [Gammaproteobacteria bacterium]|nr:hypothetical protein [Gammaproteobacteria bacterium]